MSASTHHAMMFSASSSLSGYGDGDGAPGYRWGVGRASEEHGGGGGGQEWERRSHT